MARLTAEEAAAKWAQRTAAASEDYKRGVQRVQTAPGELAARQVDKYRANVLAAAPFWAQRVRSVSLGDWQTAASEKGSQRLASGVQAAQPKMAQRMAELLPHIDRGLSQLQSMPSTTFEDNVNRAVFWMRHMKSLRSGSARR